MSSHLLCDVREDAIRDQRSEWMNPHPSRQFLGLTDGYWVLLFKYNTAYGGEDYLTWKVCRASRRWIK